MSARLLRLVGPVHVIAGLLLFVTGFVPAAHPMLESMLPGKGDLVWSPFFLAVLGPTIASWGVLFTVVVSQFLTAPSPALWRAMVWSVVIWAPLDTALCLRYSVYSGAIVNTVVVVILIVLILDVRKMTRR